MKESKHWHRFILILWTFSKWTLALLILLALFVAFPNPALKPLLVYSINSRIPGTLDIGSLSWSFTTFNIQGLTYTPSPEASPLKLDILSGRFQLDADYIPQFEQIDVTGLEISAIFDEAKGFYVEGLSDFTDPTGPDPDMAFNIPALNLSQGTIRFHTDHGDVDLILDGSCAWVDNHLKLKGHAELSSTFLSLKGNLTLDGTPPQLEGKFKLNELSVPQLFALPIEGGGLFKTSAEEVSLRGEFQTPRLGIKFKTRTHHLIKEKTFDTKMEFTIPNLKAALEASTQKIPDLPQISGGISGDANFAYADEKLKGRAHLRLHNISVRDEDYNAEGVTGTVTVTNLETYATPPGQTIKIQKLNSFLPLRQVDVAFQHKGGGRFQIERAQAALEKGTLTTSAFPFESFDKGVAFTLHMKGVSTHYLASFSKLGKLNTTGLVAGKMDLEVKDQDFAIKKGGKLWVSNPPGRIEYRPDLSKTLPHTLQKLTGHESPMDLALIALWNLHYTALSLDLEKPLGGELTATLHLKGNNPDAFSGHPFEFNIKVSGETLRLIREAMSSIE